MAQKKAAKNTMDVDRTTLIGSEFAQFATVHVTAHGVTFDFVFAHPHENYTTGQVVSRITMPHAQAQQLAELTQNLLNKDADSQGQA